jgi:nuclear protein localization family protein 4
MAQQLVKTVIIEACLNPTVVRVKESSGPRDYIPDVSYKSMNEYGVAVKKQAKPTFPVDCLIVSVLVPSF